MTKNKILDMHPREEMPYFPRANMRKYVGFFTVLAITYDYVRICIIFSSLDNYLLLKLIIHRKQSAFEGLVVVKVILYLKVYRVFFFFF